MTRRLVPLPRFRWPIVLLLLGLGLVGAALFENSRTVELNRTLAKRTILGYGGFAAWSYQQHLSEAMRNAVREALGAVNHGDQLHTGPNIPSAESLVHYLPWDVTCLCHHPRFGPNPAAIFGYTLGSDTLGVAFNQLPTPERGWVVDPPAPPAVPVHILPFDDSTRKWIIDTVSKLVRAGRSPWGFGVVVSAAADRDRSRMYAYTAMPRSAGDTIVYGIEYDAAATDSIFSTVLDDRELLPQALLQVGSNRDIMGVDVTGPDGRPMFAWAHNSSPESRLRVVAKMPPSYGAMTISAFIRPEIAPRVIIGGLPQSRLPLLLGLLGLATALTFVAVAQLRRESQFAELRADFVANVSHELRTPLTQIRLVLDTLRLGREPDPREREKSMALADREVTRLQNLVESVLRFSRAPHATSSDAPTVIDLVSESQAIVEDFRPLAKPKRVAISVDANGNFKVALRDGALRQILLNLLDNALKYGPEGQHIAVTIRPVDATRVRLSVADEGPGVATTDRDRIWRPFERGVGATTTGVGGSGIGLTVVRELVESHNGTVNVRSASPRGAVFDIDLPLVTDA